MQIIWRDSDNPATYEAARISRVFNTRHPAKFPLAIVKATSESDVVSAVQLAVKHNCRIAVRSGGHSFPVWSLHENSILIDLGDWKECNVNEERQTATVTPSITSKEINEVLVKQYGLKFPAGHCPDVGLGGFLLQGGMGWNFANWGWACERVEAVDVVTAQGEHLFCNAEQNSDLYWAARGAGPAFPGLVTRLYLQLMPHHSQGFRSSGYVYPRHLYQQVFDWVLSITPDLDSDTEITAISRHMNGEICFMLLLVSMKSTESDARAALQPAQDTRPPGALSEWFCQEDSFESLYRNNAKANPQNHRWRTDNAFLQNNVGISVILQEGFLTLPHPTSYAFWCPASSRYRKPLPDMAFSMQSDHYFAIYAAWEDEEDDTRCESWLHKVMDKIKPHGIGAYMGDSDFSVKPDRYWAPENTSRLMQIRRKWDPESRICGYPWTP